MSGGRLLQERFHRERKRNFEAHEKRAKLVHNREEGYESVEIRLL